MIVLDPLSSHAELDIGNDEHLLRKQVDEHRREQSQVQVHGDNSTRGEELECWEALLSLKLYSSPWFISALFMGKPLRLGIISKRCRLGQERRPPGNNTGEKGNSGFGWIESHIVHSPLIGRFETRNVSTDNPRRALYYPRRREREDAEPTS